MAFQSILITSAETPVAKALLQYLQAKGHAATGLTQSQLNLLWPTERLLQVLQPLQPELLIYIPPVLTPEQATSQAELTAALNRDGTRKLLSIARSHQWVVALVSTAWTVAGHPASLVRLPSLACSPVGLLGHTLAEAESLLGEWIDMRYCLRTGWLYGPKQDPLVLPALEAARLGTTWTVSRRTLGAPTWIGNWCHAVEQVVLSGAFGTYHLVEDGPPASPWDIAQKACALAGLSASTLSALPPQDDPPLNLHLDVGELAMPHWSTGLAAYLQQVGYAAGGTTP